MLDLDAIEDAYKPLPIGESSDSWEIDATYHVLVGPDFSCTLTEPEDRTWCRDGADAVKRMNEQHRRIREQDAEIERLKCACSKQNDDICQTLGQALGYPRYSDDPKNFPGATEANGACVGDHVAESLADEAANEIKRLREALEAVASDLARVRDHEYEEPFVTAGTMVKVYAALEPKGGES